jgi:hypothetical protein
MAVPAPNSAEPSAHTANVSPSAITSNPAATVNCPPAISHLRPTRGGSQPAVAYSAASSSAKRSSSWIGS